jgi:hypothetical protein
MYGPVLEPNLEIAGLRRCTTRLHSENFLSILQLYKRIAWMAQEHLAIVGTGQDKTRATRWRSGSMRNPPIASTSRPLTHGVDDFVD